MSLSKQVSTHVDRITESGDIYIKTVTRVLEDGATLSESLHREVITPGADVSGYPAAVQAVATAAWANLPEPVIVNGVPSEVTMRQARLALLGAGVLGAVTAAINGLQEPQRSAALIEWEYSSTVKRQQPLVLALGPALGLSTEQLDALFVAAAQL
jgi:hypothetical protein